MRVISTAKISSHHIQPILEKYPELIFEYGPIEEVKDKLKEAEILITYGEDLTAEIVKECKSLKWMMVVSAGLDKLPFEQLMAQNILVTNAKGIHKIPMAEHTLALMLQDSRRLVPMLDNQRKSLWDRTLRVAELAGKTLVIVGVGAIGEEIARKAKAFDMQVIGVNRSGKSVPYVDRIFKNDDLLKAFELADYVVVVTPLTPETKDLFGEKEIKAMPENCYFINIARGHVVQDEALLKALKEGWIRGAALDAFREEPLPADSPLWQAPNLIITPHLAGRSPFYMKRAMEIFKHNLEVYYTGEGEMLNVVNLERGY
ncbi:MAG: D-2-hydroxyacid dehydrogenase [Clostridia bacterium]|nr:D-2-hydroxyacid dehydrogenase [Clostridia bacterium]